MQEFPPQVEPPSPKQGGEPWGRIPNWFGRNLRLVLAMGVVAVVVVITVTVWQTQDERRRESDTTRTDITFEMKDRYRLGEPVEIRIRNNSARSTYYYSSRYPACHILKFFDTSIGRRPYPREELGREPAYLEPGRFIVPEGTHCDLVDEKPLGPGEVALLVTWRQEVCVKDVWGCIEQAPVTPGEYRIDGEFAQSREAFQTGRNREGAKFAIASRNFYIEPAPY